METQDQITEQTAEQAINASKKTIAIYQSILKRNKAYSKASPAMRRVMIAEDALQQLKAGRFIATHGTYVDAVGLATEAKIGDGNQVQLQPLLHDPMLKSPCNVCARGALLLAAVRHRNDCLISASGRTTYTSFVREFSEEQQSMIEEAFECSAWGVRFLTKSERSDPDKRLAIILKNIIRNKGTFKKNQR